MVTIIWQVYSIDRIFRFICILDPNLWWFPPLLFPARLTPTRWKRLFIPPHVKCLRVLFPNNHTSKGPNEMRLTTECVPYMRVPAGMRGWKHARLCKNVNLPRCRIYNNTPITFEIYTCGELRSPVRVSWVLIKFINDRGRPAQTQFFLHTRARVCLHPTAHFFMKNCACLMG